MTVHAADRADEAHPDAVPPPAPPSDRPRRPRWRDAAVDLAVIFGVAAVAVTQPVLDLFGRNPTFFVAGGYGRRQIVAFALVVTAVPALVVWAATATPGLAHRPLRRVLHPLGVGVFAFLFGLVVARQLGMDATAAAFGLAVLVGVGVAVAESRWRPARQFLSYLALSNVVFLGLFLLGSPSAELLRGATYADAGSVMVPPLDGPVTVIVLDEFPLAPIMRPDGSIDETRFPNLAALAGETTWFRNAASESSFTAYSVPSILSGRRASNPDLPILSHFPRNYFTLFGQSYPIRRYEAISDLCPPDSCGRPPGSPLRQALDDALLVYRHQVLPESWRADLTPIDQDWGSFGDDAAAAAAAEPSAPSSTSAGPNDLLNAIPKEDRGKAAQVRVLLDHVRQIGPEPTVNFVHVLVPHTPFVLTPWGTVGIQADVGEMPPPGDPGYERHVAELLAVQTMQIGAIDQAIGEVVAQLKQAGAWDDGTFVLMSDHGRFSLVPGNTRDYSEEVQDELLRIPLFIKAPGQTEGEVRDDPASTIDVLPSLIDLLDIDTDWEFEGHSLFDGSEPTGERRLTSDLDGLYDVARRYAEFYRHGEGWVRMAAIGPRADLVGTSVLDHRVGEPSSLTWRLDHRASLDDPSVSNGSVPVQMTGTLRSGERPDDLVVAVDGTIAGTIGVRSGSDGLWHFSGILGPPGARGEGEEVTAYEVEDVGDAVVLHPVPET